MYSGNKRRLSGMLGREKVKEMIPLANAVICMECDTIYDKKRPGICKCGSQSAFLVIKVLPALYGPNVILERVAAPLRTESITTDSETAPYPAP